MLQTIRNFLTPEQRRIIGVEAQQALDNRHLKEAFEGVADYLEEQAQDCDPDNKERAQRIVLSKQLLGSIKRELIRKIEDGEMAKIEIAELEKRRKPLQFYR